MLKLRYLLPLPNVASNNMPLHTSIQNIYISVYATKMRQNWMLGIRVPNMRPVLVVQSLPVKLLMFAGHRRITMAIIDDHKRAPLITSIVPALQTQICCRFQQSPEHGHCRSMTQ